MLKIQSVHCRQSIAVSLGLFASFAFGQTEVNEEPMDETIVIGEHLYSDRVNSLRSPTPIIDVPQSLSIVSAAQIDEQGFTSVGDIINYIPGVNTSQGEGHRDAIVFRGVRSTADFYVDGARDDVQYYRPLYNLEQVEILRGPNALLFGRGGTGGILNRVTKKGQVGESFTGYQLSAGTFGDFGVEIDTNIETGDSSALRINAFYEGLENHRDFYDGDRIGFNPTVRFDLSADTVLDLSYEYIDHERFIDRGIPTGADGRPVEAFEDILFADPDLNTTELEAHVYRASLEHRFSDGLKGNFTAFYGDYDKLYQNIYASGYDAVATPDEVTIDGYVDTTDRQNFILSANLVGEFDAGRTRHTIVAGTEYIDTSSDQDRYNTFWSVTMDDNETFSIAPRLDLAGGVGVNADGLTTTNDFDVSLNDDTRVGIEVFSLYIQDEIELTENFNLVLGARFDSFDIDVFNVPADEARSRKDEEISPRLGLIYKPADNVSIYGSYSESFLPRSGEQFANINGDNDSLDPDVFENAEIGVKWDFASALSFTAAYFQNEQISAARDDVTGENFEVRGLEIDGFELQLKGHLTDQLHITAGYSNLDGETDGGAEIPRELPENSFSLWGAYSVSERFGLGLGVTYQDESFISDFDIGSDASTHPTLPSYTRVDASAFYDLSDRFRVQLNVENLTDELYFPNAHSTHQVTVGESVNARLSVTGRF